jgi:sulfur transfer protein SufE
MSINELQDEVVAEFNDFSDWMDRYQLLIDLEMNKNRSKKNIKRNKI